VKLELNLNDYVEVALTDAGASIYNQYYAEMKAYKPENVVEGHVLKEPLWELFHVFGPFVGIGMDSPFKNCAITLKSGAG
jgi:hypothetical protein